MELVELSRLELIELKSILKFRLIELEHNRELFKDNDRLSLINNMDINIVEQLLNRLKN